VKKTSEPLNANEIVPRSGISLSQFSNTIEHTKGKITEVLLLELCLPISRGLVPWKNCLKNNHYYETSSNESSHNVTLYFRLYIVLFSVYKCSRYIGMFMIILNSQKDGSIETEFY
jgi:hypothetical protein